MGIIGSELELLRETSNGIAISSRLGGGWITRYLDSDPASMSPSILFPRQFADSHMHHTGTDLHSLAFC
jgi:hypothetical protein